MSYKNANYTGLFKLLISVIAILITVGIIRYRNIIGEFQQWGYIGVFVASLIGNATILMPVPIIMTIGAMGSTLNPLIVGLCASLGAAFGESIGYSLGLAGNIIVEKSDMYERAKKHIEQYGVWAIFALAVVPNPLFDLAGIMAGTMGISYRQFFVAVWAGAFLKYTIASAIGFGLLAK